MSVRPAVVCAGGAVLDRHLHLFAPAVPATSNPATASTSPGGVARNVAENLALLGVPVRLVSRVGGDDAGRELTAALTARGIDVAAVAVEPTQPTAQYVAVLDPHGDLVIGVAAMDVLERITADQLDGAWPGPGEWLFADCNLPATVLAALLNRGCRDGTPIAVDAVSAPKVARLAGARGARPLRGVTVLFCNLDEAEALRSALGGTGGTGGRTAADAAERAASDLVVAGAAAVVLTLGVHGVVVADAAGGRRLPARSARVVDVTGAGDALVAATLARLGTGATLDDAVRAGTIAAALTVESPASVRGDLATALAREENRS